MFLNSFWALVPSIISIVLALIIKEPHISLFVGAFIAAFLAADLNILTALDIFIQDGLVQSITDNAGVVVFVISLGIIILMLNITGGAASFGRWAGKRIKTPVGAMLLTFFLGILIFIDDMFNCFTVGAAMKPITDSQRVSRQKLAYLLDATAAPICMIAPISSWGAAVSTTANGLGTGMSGLELFIKAIPYNYYSLLTLVFILTIGILNFDYGQMKKFQENAQNGDIDEADGAKEVKISDRGKVYDLVIPVVVMIIVCTFALMYVGGFFDESSLYYHDIAGSFGNTDGTVALPWGGIIALVFTYIYSLLRKTITFKEACSCIPKSFETMASPIIILILAVALKNMTSVLGAREFIAGIMQNAAEGIYNMLPAAIFVCACLLAFASGTSWGTFSILIPIVTSVFPVDSKLMIMGISACLAGAVCGDHCSPISDTTIMSSAAAGCNHVSHVTTQLPYAVTVALISFVVYVINGYIQNAVIGLIIGCLLTIGTLVVIKRISNQKA